MEITKDDWINLHKEIGKIYGEINIKNEKISEQINNLSLGMQDYLKDEIKEINHKIDEIANTKYDIKELYRLDKDKSCDINNIGSKISIMSSEIKNEIKTVSDAFIEMLKHTVKNIESGSYKYREEHDNDHVEIKKTIDVLECHVNKCETLSMFKKVSENKKDIDDFKGLLKVGKGIIIVVSFLSSSGAVLWVLKMLGLIK